MNGHATASSTWDGLSTPLVVDACLRLGIAPRLAPPGLQAVVAGMRAAGRVLPARHRGSVDALLEAVEAAQPGDVLVIDDGGRREPACVGDLVTLEARGAGIAGILVWGAHRDTAELREIGLPLFSVGPFPAGPTRLDPAEPVADGSVRFGEATVGGADVVVADDDGAVFVAAHRASEVARVARDIAAGERAQADRVRRGITLREQLRFQEYRARRAADPEYTFRAHLRRIGGEIEE